MQATCRSSRSGLGSGMRFFVFRSDVITGEMGVDLRGRDTRVTEEFLDVPQGCSSAKEMGREAMAQRMWCDLPLNIRLLGQALEDKPKTLASETFASPVKEQSPIRFRAHH